MWQQSPNSYSSLVFVHFVLHFDRDRLVVEYLVGRDMDGLDCTVADSILDYYIRCWSPGYFCCRNLVDLGFGGSNHYCNHCCIHCCNHCCNRCYNRILDLNCMEVANYCPYDFIIFKTLCSKPPKQDRANTCKQNLSVSEVFLSYCVKVHFWLKFFPSTPGRVFHDPSLYFFRNLLYYGTESYHLVEALATPRFPL